MSYVRCTSYVNYTCYVCRFYELYDLFKLCKFFMNCLKMLEITWICFIYNIFCFQKFCEYKRTEIRSYKNENIEKKLLSNTRKNKFSKAQSMVETNFGNWKPFKNDKKYFLFSLKFSFFSQDIEVFYLDFLAMYKNSLIRKITLILKFMTSQSG